MLNVYRNYYQFNSSKKYLIYYTGNFSPPHKGHMKLIQEYFNLKNIQILIHLWGNEDKHGVNIETSIEILNIYLKNVNNVFIEKYDPTYSRIFQYKKIDNFIFIRGDENFIHIKKDYINIYRDLIKKLRKKGIQSDSLLINRSSISSSKMCKDKENLSKYLPDYLSEIDSKRIIKILQKINLK